MADALRVGAGLPRAPQVMTPAPSARAAQLTRDVGVGCLDRAHARRTQLLFELLQELRSDIDAQRDATGEPALDGLWHLGTCLRLARQRRHHARVDETEVEE